jgi:predicted DNA-binding transcriptional regulator AlpA
MPRTKNKQISTGDTERSTRQSAVEGERLAHRRKRAAALLGVSESLLRKWEHEGKGPKFTRVGRAVLYPARSLAEWLESHATDPEAA